LVLLLVLLVSLFAHYNTTLFSADHQEINEPQQEINEPQQGINEPQPSGDTTPETTTSELTVVTLMGGAGKIFIIYKNNKKCFIFLIENVSIHRDQVFIFVIFKIILLLKVLLKKLSDLEVLVCET
jgi:presenilin-like A22 family membrane protease